MHGGALVRGSRAWVRVGTLAWEARVEVHGAGKGSGCYQQVMWATEGQKCVDMHGPMSTTNPQALLPILGTSQEARTSWKGRQNPSLTWVLYGKLKLRAAQGPTASRPCHRHQVALLGLWETPTLPGSRLASVIVDPCFASGPLPS